MDKAADRELSYQILTLRYSPGKEPRWFLMVYPVESRLRKQANDLLEIEGVQRIRDFLMRRHTETELLTGYQFRCIFDPVERIMTYQHEKE